MSIQAVSWVLEHSTTKGADRLVLLSLANHADELGECWPSVERIAREANITPVHAKRTLSALSDGGHIARVLNGAPDQRVRPDRRTNLYRILDGGAQKLPRWLDGGQNESATGAISTRDRGASEVPPNHHENHQLEPSLLASTDAFEAFWREYPKARRLAKPDARAAFKEAVKKCSAEKLLEAVKRYAADPNRLDEFTPYPQKWLRQERWNAPPEVPRRQGPGRPQPVVVAVDEDRSGESGRLSL